MSKLANLTVQEDIKESANTLGGAFGALDSDAYLMTIEAAYLGKSESGAQSLSIIAKTQEGREFRHTLWMTSGTAKGGKNYYEDKDGNKKYLPGFEMARHLALLAAGKELSDLDFEERVIKLYNSEAKKDMPTPVDMAVDLVGQQVYLGIMKQVVDKTQKNESTGAYEATGETREQNEIAKIFRAEDQLTVQEITGGQEDTPFFHGWVEKYKGTVQNRAKGAAASGTAGAPKAAAANAANKRPTTSLFGKKEA